MNIDDGGTQDALIGALALRIDRVVHLEPATRMVGLILVDEGKRQINDQGDPSWIPNQKGTHTGIDGGHMLQSLSEQDAIEVEGGSGSAGTTGVPYAKYFQDGTGIFAGHKTWKAKWNGRTVVHRGQPKRPFLVVNDRVNALIAGALRRYVVTGEAGLS